jgi:hypothetical membrane protein
MGTQISRLPKRPCNEAERNGQDQCVLRLTQRLAAAKGPARLIAGRKPVAAWAVAAAVLSEVLLIGGWLIAGALQPASYSPMQQTMSDLAGQTATDPWVMTAAFFGAGSCQLVTGLGLTRVAVPARMLLLVAGLSTIGVAASPEAATGPTLRHLVFAVSCVVTTLVWPVFVVRREPAMPQLLSLHSTVVVTAAFAALSGWLLVTTQGGADLGMVERLTSSVQGLWPLVVAVALRRAETSWQPAPSRDLPPSWQPPPAAHPSPAEQPDLVTN